MASLSLSLTSPFAYNGELCALPLHQRLRHYRDPSFHETNIGAIADVAAQSLRSLPRFSPREAESHADLSSTRTFLKTACKQCPQNGSVKKCKREFLAFRLGIPSTVLDEEINPGFEKFAQDAHLDRYLIIFNHTLVVGEGGKLSIRCGGELKPWESVAEIALAKAPELRNPLPKLYNPPLKYNAQGVTNSHFYNWIELQPFMRVENPPWGKRYVFEICSLCTGNFRLFGDHTWIRLKTPDGDIYAPGLYREDNDVPTGFNVKKGRFQNPDTSEFWPEKIHSIGFEINEESFNAIKSQVEKDHNEDRTAFHVLSRNCTAYAFELAKLAGIEISAKMSFVNNFLPASAQGTLATGLHYLTFPLLNLAQIKLGAMGLSRHLSPEEKARIKPHINSVHDVLTPSKIEMQAPYILAFQVMKKIEALRQAEASRQGVDPSTLQYWTPPQYRACKGEPNSVKS